MNLPGYDAWKLESGYEMTAAEENEIDALTARVAELEAALRGVMALIESGELVRDISKDGADGFAMRMMPFVRTLTIANAALAKGA